MRNMAILLALATLLMNQPANAFRRGPDNPDDGFSEIDVNRDGLLSKEEFLEHGPNPPFISTEKIFETIDADHDGQITKQEYVDAWNKRKGKSDE